MLRYRMVLIGLFQKDWGIALAGISQDSIFNTSVLNSRPMTEMEMYIQLCLLLRPKKETPLTPLTNRGAPCHRFLVELR